MYEGSGNLSFISLTLSELEELRTITPEPKYFAKLE